MTEYVKNRLKDRVFCLPLPKKELEDIVRHILTLTTKVYGNVCIKIKEFDIDVVRQDPDISRRRDNTLWVVFNDGLLTTMYRRGESQVFPENHLKYYRIEEQLI